MGGDDIASTCLVLRSRRPQTRLEASLHENRETSETPALPTRRVAGRRVKAQGRTTRMFVAEGVGQRHNTDESFEQNRAVDGGE